MKILVVNNMAPFVSGGAEELATHLQRNLIKAGHQSEVLRIPFQWEPASCIPSQMLMVRSLELVNVDRVIALKFPAYLIKHPHKTLWLLHQYRQAYDLFEIGQTNLPTNPVGQAIRNAILAADCETFREAQRIFVNSKVTQERLKKFNNFPSEILLPPINDPELFPGGPSQGYIFAGGRINRMKRQHLLIPALAQTPKHVKLIIAGPPDSPDDASHLQKLVEQYDLKDRIKLDLRFLPRQQYADYLNHSSAVAYLPFDEDSLGYVSMEAALAAKPVITTRDSGGILELIQSQQTGWICEPDPKSLAQAMAEAMNQHQKAKDLGYALSQLWNRIGITWPKTIETLLA